MDFVECLWRAKPFSLCKVRSEGVHKVISVGLSTDLVGEREQDAAPGFTVDLNVVDTQARIEPVDEVLDSFVVVFWKLYDS